METGERHFLSRLSAAEMEKKKLSDVIERKKASRKEKKKEKMMKMIRKHREEK
jgi:hypothetical protein